MAITYKCIIMEKIYYAHSLEKRSPKDWQLLEEHLQKVAEMAAEFAKPFGGDQWACLTGLWHDLGKYADAYIILKLDRSRLVMSYCHNRKNCNRLRNFVNKHGRNRYL